MTEDVFRPAVLAVIPARYGSTRFPGKMIAALAGKPLVLHAYERAHAAKWVTEVVVATDDERVARALEPYNARLMMTRADHASGTDRVAEVAAQSQADIVVNVQGDEPLIDPHTIDETIAPLLREPDLPMATAARRITDPALITNPNVVKVVCDRKGRALYFSRCPIPYIRDDSKKQQAGAACYLEHVGLYVFRRQFLVQYAGWAPTPLERLEKLEQLRVLEHGYSIAVVETEHASVGVDTPEDLDRVRMLLAGADGYGKDA